MKSLTGAMVSIGLKEVGEHFVITDNGFFGGRASVGNLLVHTTQFPNGIKVIAINIHAKDLKPG